MVKVASCKSRVSVVHDCWATVMRRVVAQQSGVRRMVQCCGGRVTATRLASPRRCLCVVQKLHVRLVSVTKPSPESRMRVAHASAGSCRETSCKTLSQLCVHTLSVRCECITLLALLAGLHPCWVLVCAWLQERHAMSTCERAFCASWACLWLHIPMLAPLCCGTTQCHLQGIPLRGTKVVTRRTVKHVTALT